MENNTVETTGASMGTPASSNWKNWAVGGALGAILLGGGAMFVHSNNLENDLKNLRSNTATQIEALKTSSSAQAAAHEKTVADMNAQIAQAQTNARNFAAAQARMNAERVAKNTTEMVNNLQAAQKDEAAKVAAAIGEMKSSADSGLAQVNGKVGEVATEVGNVKTELGNTKSTLDSTIAELKTVKGDLGVQSGLIATNSKELAALRELGDRNYYEFTLSKTQPVATLAGVNMKLRKADVKRNKFNLDLVSDDKKVEKKDKTVHEPVQFYVSGMRQPFEIVVTEVGKDKITGYLATPKVMSARR